jgi:hypothetical protein
MATIMKVITVGARSKMQSPRMKIYSEAPIRNILAVLFATVVNVCLVGKIPPPIERLWEYFHDFLAVPSAEWGGNPSST